MTISDRSRAIALLLGAIATAACFPVPPTTDAPEPETTATEDAEPPLDPDPAPPSDTAVDSTSGTAPQTSTQPSSQTTPQPPPQPSQQISAPPEVGSFTTEALFDIGGGGCGMSLWRADSDPRQDGFILFNGIDGVAVMSIDGNLIPLERKTASGDEFYGQFTSQTFVGPDAAFSATANVVLGEPGEIESVAIPAGTLIVQSDSDVVEIPVAGDAGC